MVEGVCLKEEESRRKTLFVNTLYVSRRMGGIRASFLAQPFQGRMSAVFDHLEGFLTLCAGTTEVENGLLKVEQVGQASKAEKVREAISLFNVEAGIVIQESQGSEQPVPVVVCHAGGGEKMDPVVGLGLLATGETPWQSILRKVHLIHAASIL